MTDVNTKTWLKEFYTPAEKSGVDLLRMVKQARRIIEDQDKRLAELEECVLKIRRRSNEDDVVRMASAALRGAE